MAAASAAAALQAAVIVPEVTARLLGPWVGKVGMPMLLTWQLTRCCTVTASGNNVQGHGSTSSEVPSSQHLRFQLSQAQHTSAHHHVPALSGATPVWAASVGSDADRTTLGRQRQAQLQPHEQQQQQWHMSCLQGIVRLGHQRDAVAFIEAEVTPVAHGLLLPPVLAVKGVALTPQSTGNDGRGGDGLVIRVEP